MTEEGEDRARKGVDFGIFAPALKKDIRVHLIIEHWDDLGRGDCGRRSRPGEQGPYR